MRNNVNYLSYLLLVLAVAFLTYQNYKINKEIDMELITLKDEYKKNKIHSTIYYDRVIESLKKTNKELYDSVKIFKDKIDYLIEFKYSKKYKIDTVYIDTTNVKENIKINTFEYFNTKNDTLNYILKIGSVEEPNWYSLNLSVSDKFTIINKRDGELNNTTIKPQNKGDIEDVTVIKTKKRKKILDRIAVGPSISVGYDFAKKEPEVMLGVSATFNMLGN